MSRLHSTRVKAPAPPRPSKPNVVPATMYDELVRNPDGRISSDLDKDDLERRFIRRMTPFNISTFNVRTINHVSKKEELLHHALQYNIDVICLQEHRTHHPEVLMQEKTGAYLLVTASAEKNTINATVRGVGFLLSPRAQKACHNINKINERIVVLTLLGNPQTTVICCYSPTNEERYTSDTENFYKTLSTAVADVPAHNLLIIGGDFNAQLGPEKARFTYHKASNKNGRFLTDFMEQWNLSAANTRFQNRPNRLWTHRSPRGYLSQLDYILVRRKWQNSIKNCRAYTSFTSVGSDHKIVSGTFKISYRQSKPPTKDPMKQIDWKKVSSDNALNQEFTISVHNRYSALIDLLDDPTDISSKYDKLVDATRETALDSLPRQKKKSHLISNSGKVQEARRVLKSVANSHRARPTRGSGFRLDAAKIALKDAYTRELEEQLLTKTKELEKAHIERRHGAAWEALREITNKKASPIIKISGDTTQERLNKWFDHFSTLLGTPDQQSVDLNDPFYNRRVSERSPINTNLFTMEELQAVLKNLNKAKTPGPDNIPAFLWKHELFHNQLLEFCNGTFKGKKPKAFSKSCIIPLPKTGDLQQPNNYRGITLSAIASKVYNSLLLNRITPHLDPILRRNQNGFRKKRSTLPQILAIRRIIEELKVSKRRGTIIFVDFSKAFDSVNRAAMIHILHNYGLPVQIVEAIAIMYESPTSFVQSHDGPTKEFNTTAGILQGDTLAPFLFVIVVDYALRQSVDEVRDKGLMVGRRSDRQSEKYLTDLDYADDIALTAEHIQSAQTLLISLEEAAAKVGLKLNSKKTECMLMNEDPTHPCITSMDGSHIKEVEDFKYLGSYVADSRKDFLARKGQAWNACNKLLRVWKSGVSTSTKVSFFRACVESILLYGAETWTMKKELQDRLDGTYTRLLMCVKNISWKTHPTKEQIYGELPPITTTIARRRVIFAGHCFRAKDQAISDILLWRLPQSSRGTRPHTYPDTISRDTGLTFQELGAAMADRTRWKEVAYRISTTVEG